MKQNSRLVGVDIARVLAALCVALFHYSYELRGQAGALYSLFWPGRFGVEIFFVVSGFAIAFSAAGNTAAGFARSRVLRLVPVAYICTIVSAGLGVACGLWSPAIIFGPLVRTLAFFPYPTWVEGVFWTLGVEISFYSLVALLVWRRRFDWLPNVMLGLVAISALYLIAGGAAASFDPLLMRTLDLGLLRHAAYFAVGVLLWFVSDRGWSPFLALSLLLSLLVGAFQVFVAAGRWVPAGASEWVAVVFWLVGTGLVAWSAFAGSKAPSPVRSIVAVAGIATYPLYLLHYELGRAAVRALANVGTPAPLAVGLALLGAISAALAVTLLAEPVVKRWLSALLDVVATRSRRARRAAREEGSA